MAVCALVALVLRYRRKYKKRVSHEMTDDLNGDVKVYQERKSKLHSKPVDKTMSELHEAPVAECSLDVFFTRTFTRKDEQGGGLFHRAC